MKPINATTLSGFALTAIALYLLSYVTFIPAWPIFIAWACFFHMGGGVDKNQAFFATLRHIWLGAFTSWISALVVLNNPLSDPLGSQLWAPILIAAFIAVLMRLSAFVQLSVTPAIIYGYASIWAFLSLPGAFTQDNLLSLTFHNAILAVGFCVLLGVCAGYLNATLVSFLCNFNLKTSASKN